MASTITLTECLVKLANDVGETRSAFINNVSSQTVFDVFGISLGQTTSFKYGLATILGKGTRQITAYNDAGQRITVVSSFDSTVSAGELVQVCWWDAAKTTLAINAVNQAIRDSYPHYYRQIVGRDSITGTVAIVGTTAVTGTSTKFLDDLIIGCPIKIGSEVRVVSAITSNTALTVSSAFTATASGQTCYHASNLTFAAGTHVYALPSSVHELLRVGWALSSSDPVTWIPPLSTWRVTGSEGSYHLELYPTSDWSVQNTSVDSAYSSPVLRGGTLADLYHNYEIFLKYLCREPELTSLTDVTNLPIQYFDVASEVYIRQRLTAIEADSPEAARLNSVYPAVEARAKVAKEWMQWQKPNIGTLIGPILDLR